MTTFPPPVRPALSVIPPQPPTMYLSSRRVESGGSIRLVLAGELDLASRSHLAGDIDAALRDSDRVLLDLSALTFLDCACVAVLFSAARRARRQGAVLILLGPHGQVRRLLDLTGAPPEVAVLDHTDLQKPFLPVAA